MDKFFICFHIYLDKFPSCERGLGHTFTVDSFQRKRNNFSFSQIRVYMSIHHNIKNNYMNLSSQFASCFRFVNFPFLSLKFPILLHFTLHHPYHNHIIYIYCNSLNITSWFNTKFSSILTQTSKSKINRVSKENHTPTLIFRVRALLIEWINGTFW